MNKWKFGISSFKNKHFPMAKNTNQDEIWVDGLNLDDERTARLIAHVMELSFQRGWNEAHHNSKIIPSIQLEGMGLYNNI